MSGIFNRRRALQALGAIAVAQGLSGGAQAKPETFMIFFDFGEATPPPSAKPLIDGLRSIVKAKARINIEGHCDTAELDPGKLGLIRAVEVLRALAEPGLPAGVQLTVVNQGAGKPMLKTGPNTKQAQNRRVTVTIG